MGGYSQAGGDGGCVAGLSVVWCARSGSGRCDVFLVGRCRTDVEIWSSSWTEVSCYETACLVQRCVDELVMRGMWNEHRQDSNTPPLRDMML